MGRAYEILVSEGGSTQTANFWIAKKAFVLMRSHTLMKDRPRPVTVKAVHSRTRLGGLSTVSWEMRGRNAAGEIHGGKKYGAAKYRDGRVARSSYLLARVLSSHFSTGQLPFHVTHNLDPRHEKRTMNSCAFASHRKITSSEALRASLQSWCAKSLLKSTLRVSHSLTILCSRRLGVPESKSVCIQWFASFGPSGKFQP
jgi:hypothetical protein